MGGYDLLDGSPDSAAPSRVYDAHYEAFPLREGIRDDISIFGLTVNANLGFADLTSATSYFGRLGYQVQDASESIYYSNRTRPTAPPFVERRSFGSLRGTGSVAPAQPGDPADLARRRRLALGGRRLLQLICIRSGTKSAQSPLNPTDSPDGSYFISWNDYGVRQTAVFADGSYKFTDQWKLSAGVRYYDYASHQDEYSWGYDGPNPTPPAQSKITQAKNSGFNPRINLSYTPTPDLTRTSRSRRASVPAAPTRSCRRRTSRRTVRTARCRSVRMRPGTMRSARRPGCSTTGSPINSDVYYIKWTGIQQVLTLPCGYQYYNNAGNGRSFGPELEINAKLSDEWSASLSGAYTDAKITRPNASYTSFLENVATFPDGVTHPCTAGTSARRPS